MANAIREVHAQNSNHILMAHNRDESSQYSHSPDMINKIWDRHSDTQLLLLNFQRKTDPTGSRLSIWQALCNREVASTFIVCIEKSNGVNISALPTIYARNCQYPFWLSPRGNGLDCHRTWEALYLNVIPIVWNSTLNPLYADLPVIILNDWKQITEKFLRTKLSEIIVNKVKRPAFYRLEKLKFSFWQKLILSKSRHPITTAKRNNQCWRAATRAQIG